MNATVNWLKQLHRTLLRLEDALLIILLSGMILLATGQILLRNLWDTGTDWGDPTLRLLVLWIALLGAMAATRDNNHIRIDLLSHFLPDRYKSWMARFTDLFSAIICGLVAWHGTRFVLFELEDGMLFLDRIPIWVCELIIPIGFGVMGLRFLIRAILGDEKVKHA